MYPKIGNKAKGGMICSFNEIHRLITQVCSEINSLEGAVNSTSVVMEIFCVYAVQQPNAI